MAQIPITEIAHAVADATMSAHADYLVHDDAVVVPAVSKELLAVTDCLAQILATVRETHAAVARLEAR